MPKSDKDAALRGTFLTEVEVDMPAHQAQGARPQGKGRSSPVAAGSPAEATTDTQLNHTLHAMLQEPSPHGGALARSKALQQAAVAAANAHDAFPQLGSAYYAHLPFQPGVDSVLWLALQAGGRRPMRGFNVPATLISDGQETAWLRTRNTFKGGATPSLSVKVGGNLDRWLFSFRSGCVAESCFDMGLAADLASTRLEALTAAQGLAVRLAKKAEEAKVTLRGGAGRAQPPSRAESPPPSGPSSGQSPPPAQSSLPRPVRFNFKEEHAERKPNSKSAKQRRLSPVPLTEQESVPDSKGRKVNYAWAATPHARATGGGSTRSIVSSLKTPTQKASKAVQAFEEAGTRNKERTRARELRSERRSSSASGGASLLRGARMAARQADAGADLRTIPLAILRSPAPWAGGCRSDSTVLTAASFASRLLSADRAKFLVQSFVKSRGRHPLTYRVTWRKQGPAKVLALHMGGSFLFTSAKRGPTGQPVQPVEEVEELLAPVEGGSLEVEGGGSSSQGMSRVGDVTPEEEQALTRSLVVSTAFVSDDALEAAAAAGGGGQGRPSTGEGGGLIPFKSLQPRAQACSQHPR